MGKRRRKVTVLSKYTGKSFCRALDFLHAQAALARLPMVCESILRPA
jgi:hypothetical protein